jgi:hypothetical protein
MNKLRSIASRDFWKLSNSEILIDEIGVCVEPANPNL